MFFIMEFNPTTGQIEIIDRHWEQNIAIGIAKDHLAFLPSSAIEAGFTVIVENNAGVRVWGVGT